MKKYIFVVFALSLILLLTLLSGSFVASAETYTIALTAPTAGGYPRNQNMNVIWTAVGPVTSIVDLQLRKANDNSLVASVNSLGMANSPYSFNPLSHGVPAGVYYFKAELWDYSHTLLLAFSAPTPNFTILNGPDLIISAPAVLTITPTTVAAGGRVSLPSWQMKNQGDAPANNFISDIRLSSDPIITIADTYLDGGGTNNLAPGEVSPLIGSTFIIPANTPAGNYYVGILLDKNNVVAESNETNNYKSVPLTVIPPPDPAITVISPNGGEKFVAGNVYEVSFKPEDIPNSNSMFFVYLKPENINISTREIARFNNDGTKSFQWTVPIDLKSGQYKIAVVCQDPGTGHCGESAGFVSDLSDNWFEIVSTPPPCAGSPCVAMVYPNGGEILVKGKTNTFRWFSNGVPIANPSPLDHFQLELGDYTFSAPIGSNSLTSDLDFTRLLPGLHSATVAYYRNEQRLASDTSNASFAINNFSPITLSRPNGGEVWQLNRGHWLNWYPQDGGWRWDEATQQGGYHFDLGINTGSTTVAYLEKLVNSNFVTIGKIQNPWSEQGSWSVPNGWLVGEFQEPRWRQPADPRDGQYPYYDPWPYLAPPGDYYIRVVNQVTGAWNRTPKPFTFAPENTIWADLKVNGSDWFDRALIVPKDATSTDYLASWTSNATLEKCYLYSFFSSRPWNRDLPWSDDEATSTWENGLPASGSRTIKAFPFANVQPGTYGYVGIDCPTSMEVSGIEGGGYDTIYFYYDSLPPPPATAATNAPGGGTVTVAAPNKKEIINWSSPYQISWLASDEVDSVSIALYKNNVPYKLITPSFPAKIGNYHWLPSKTITTNELGDNFQIFLTGRTRQSKSTGTIIQDISDAPFSIINSTPSPTNDPTPPSTITSLKLTDTYPNGQAGLNWRAPYEDSNDPSSGTVAAYDIRYQTKSPITDSSWSRAVQVTDEPAPRAPGTVEIYFLSHLTSGTYYVAIKSQDSAGNLSALSNNLLVTIPEPPTPTPIVPVQPVPISPSPQPAPIPAPISVVPMPITPAPLPTLLSSTPPNNAVMAQDSSGPGWNLATLTFSANLGRDWNRITNYSISTTNPEPISIANINGSALQSDVVFSRPLLPDERITITHQPTNSSVCLGFLPGDVNQDGRFNATDIGGLRSLIGTPEGATKPLYQTDINRDGNLDQADLDKARELLSDPNTIKTLPACPK